MIRNLFHRPHVGYKRSDIPIIQYHCHYVQECMYVAEFSSALRFWNTYC